MSGVVDAGVDEDLFVSAPGVRLDREQDRRAHPGGLGAQRQGSGQATAFGDPTGDGDR